MHEFLSPDWIKAVQAIRDEYLPQRPKVDVPPVRVNLEITGAPENLSADGVIRAHADTVGASWVLDVGALENPDLTIVVDRDTAYALLVTQRPNAAIGAFLTGRIRVDGDLSRLAGATDGGGFDPAALPGLLAGLGITGSSTLADVDPLAAQIGDRIRALTL